MLLIPKHINAGGLIPFLEQLAAHSEMPSLVIDFSELQRVSPAGLASLAAFVSRRIANRLATDVAGMETCAIRDYLRRMNLLRLCGWDQDEETFVRHESYGRFVPLELIPHQVDDLGAQVASCIAPGGEEYGHRNAGLYDTAWYLVTEMANNVRQHSRGTGFVAAQTTISDGYVRIAIADGGCGISTSLKDAGFSWAQDLPDEDLIEQAMVARVSSKGQPANEGVGLTLSSRIVDLMLGQILIVSGAGTVIRGGGAVLKKSRFAGCSQFPGTLITISFLRSAASEFDSKLHEAKELEIPLRAPARSASFQP